jgi:hypothetical protein
MSAVFDVFDFASSDAGVLLAAPPQALKVNRTASPAAAVWTLLMVFMVLPFECFQLNLLLKGVPFSGIWIASVMPPKALTIEYVLFFRV